jgi:hypothetical protein
VIVLQEWVVDKDNEGHGKEVGDENGRGVSRALVSWSLVRQFYLFLFFGCGVRTDYWLHDEHGMPCRGSRGGRIIGCTTNMACLAAEAEADGFC